MTNLDLLC